MAKKESQTNDGKSAQAPKTGAQNSSSGVQDRRTPFSDEELQHFRELIMKRRRAAREDIERMRGQIEEAREQASDNTAYSFHMADAGTDAMEREKLYLMIARQQKYIGYLDRALERIDDKTYGICKVTGEPIAKERLEAVPHTEISIAAKQKQKKKEKQNG
ncbi:molecular chaperone DnaK [Longibacter salinarum]|uniref:Molecular chaperone DnaK n=1 Tax=Longibacter salinarum TaxID=1850348 RepID=A0A2A8CXZ8_9BACT|nr:TraR/DksA C4-type zinc finger protein [Longibacter salinarum]PEN13457.1 molecular chaperone DnaK [Longibacter salinarum]